jgi:squalene synthase HpnD
MSEFQETVAAPAETMPDLPGSDAITRSAKSNLALSFTALPKPRREAMSVLYAFCRVVDDVADSTELPLEEKRRRLGEWRKEIHRAYLGTPLTPLGCEMAQIIRTYLIAPTPLEEILNGMEMDMTLVRYPTFALLDQYCYRVASAVGLVSIDIFGCRQPQTRHYAVALGMAFQLTNILRDVKKDASFGRIYLPLDELASFGVTEADIMEGRFTEKMRQLFRFQHHRARHYFAKAHRLMVPDDRPRLLAAEIMREVYEEVLNEIERRRFDVMSSEVKFGKFKKYFYLPTRAKRREKHALPRPPAPKKVVVLGAGYAGLAAAQELVWRGHDVTLLEGRALLGGRAHSFVDTKSGLVLDNGQHILMGCYHETLRLLRRLGVMDRLYSPPRMAVPFLSEKGRSTLAATAPDPLHLLSALLGYGELSGADKISAVGLALRLRLGRQPLAGETVGAWMRRWRQTPNIIRALWEPLCIAALNEPVATASAQLFATVIRRSFLGGAADSTILLSRVGLSELFAPEVRTLLEMCRGSVRLQTPVTGLRFEGEMLREIKLGDGSSLQPGAVVSALPWHVLRGLLPEESKLARACARIQDAPIVSLHLWLDRPILREPFVGLLDSPVHWVFSRDHIHGPNPSGHEGHVITAVVSGARDLIDKTGPELEELTLRELRRFLPEARDARVLHRMVYKARSATFAATPATEPLRPGVATEWSNLWLAGDWTNTALPATIEGAIVSGVRAARAVDEAVMNTAAVSDVVTHPATGGAGSRLKA